MATYISLVKLTSQGVKDIKNGPARVEAYKAACQQVGATLKAAYLTFGRCDRVVITEGPDDVTAARLALATAMQGNVSTETMRAFTDAEYRDIVAGLP